MQRRHKGYKRGAKTFELVLPNGAVMKTAPIPESRLRRFIRETCGDEPVYYRAIK